MAISTDAAVRLTTARIMSYWAEVRSSAGSGSKRRSMAFCTRWGTMPVQRWLAMSVSRTRLRERNVEPKRSSSSCCEASESSVSATCCDFFEKKSVSTMIRPEASRIRKLARAGSSSCPIMMASLPASRAICQASKLASGTPMKLTRSFPAKASARANVPERMVMRMMLSRMRWKIHSTAAATTQKASSVSSTWSVTYSEIDVGISPELLSPLKRAK